MVVAVKLTANFERNLETIAGFLDKLGAPDAYDRLLDELNDTLIPNLERFPSIGRLFLERAVRSVEVENALSRLQAKLTGSVFANICFQIIWCFMLNLAMWFICCRSSITVNFPLIFSA